MSHIIQSLKAGHELRPMKSAGSFFEDGFYILNKKNGLIGFSEVMTSDVLSLERKGLIFFNPYKFRYVLKKIKGGQYGVEKHHKRTKKA